MKPSKTGYKSTSKDKNNPYNIIPSGNITMSGVPHKVLGIDDLGNKKMMLPGVKNYQFPGNTVLEIPIKQTGGDTMRYYQTGGESGLSPERAAEILRQGHVYGTELSDAQRTHFANIAGTDEEGNSLDENQDDSQTDSSQDDSGISDEEFMKYGGIHINPSKKGTFTAAATKHGKSVQEFASQVLANKGAYSEAMIKKANFARNASHFKHQEGGNVSGDYAFPTYQTGGGFVPPPNATKVDTVAPNFNKTGTIGNKTYYDTSVNKAIPSSTPASANWEKSIIDKLQKGASPQSLVDAGHIAPSAIDKYKQYYKPVYTEAAASTPAPKAGIPLNPSYQGAQKEVFTGDKDMQIFQRPHPEHGYSRATTHYVDRSTGKEITGDPYDANGAYKPTFIEGSDTSGFKGTVKPSGWSIPAQQGQTAPVVNTMSGSFRYGGSNTKGDVERFIKNYNKKMGGSTAQQGSTTDSIVGNKKATFTQYLQQNAMNRMLREELPDLMHHMAYGGMYQAGGSNGFQGQAQQDAMNSGSPYAPGAFENNEAGPDYQNGMTTDPSQAMGNLGQPLDTSGTKQAYKDSHEAMNFQRQQNDISHPHDNSPSWMQKHGQQVAMGTIAGLNVAAGMFGANDAKNAQKRLNSKTSADNVFQTNHGANRGDYETNSGAFRPNQNTPVQFAGKNSAQPYKAGGDVSSRLEAKPSYKAGDTHELTEQEISHLVSRGYKLQYL